MTHSELAHLKLLAEVDALIDQLDRWADGCPAWRPSAKCRSLVRRLTDRLASLRVRIEAPLVVATLGGTGTGKSALVNALLGAQVVETGRSRPTTTRPTLVCRPGLTPEMLGIDASTVELIDRDLPALRDLVLIDCPDADTTECPAVLLDAVALSARQTDEESAPAGSNLARLRAILPKCDVLLVTTTQQKYRSARMADEFAVAAPGACVVFVQTHADREDDIRSDWRHVLETPRLPFPSGMGVLGEGCENVPHPVGRIFRVDSLQALADTQAGLQPRGEFADLLDLLTRHMAGAAGNRIRRANVLDLTADTLDSCRAWIDAALPAVRQLQDTLCERRALLAAQLAGEMRAELLASRRQWEHRLLAKTTSRWGLSPFALVLRAYQGIGGMLAGALLYRARTPAQIALWGTLEGVRTWRKTQQARQTDHRVGVVAGGWDTAELRKAALVVEGYLSEAGLDRPAPFWDTVTAEAETAAAAFVARVSSELESLVAQLAQRHTGWFTRWCYEIMLLAMLVAILYRLGKNFFYDSWLAQPPVPVYGLNFYLSAGFWLILWCLLLLWAFCSRLRRGLSGRLDQLAAGWQDASSAAGLFASVETACRRVDQYRQDLDTIRQEVKGLQQHI